MNEKAQALREMLKQQEARYADDPVMRAGAAGDVEAAGGTLRGRSPSCGLRVFAPHTRRSDGDDDDDGGPERLGFHVAVVFDVGQTDALPPKESQ